MITLNDLKFWLNSLKRENKIQDVVQTESNVFTFKVPEGGEFLVRYKDTGFGAVDLFYRIDNKSKYYTSSNITTFNEFKNFIKHRKPKQFEEFIGNIVKEEFLKIF